LISPECAAGADLAKAAAALPPEMLTARVSGVHGRPYALTITRRASDKLHAACPGCSCQCRGTTK
jgi:hypothetical protein